MKKVKIALLGLGNVGRGVYNILIKNKEDYNNLKNEIKGSKSNINYDLNRAGKVDITDLTYVHQNMDKSVVTSIIEDTNIIIRSENVDIKAESTQVVGSGYISDILKDNGITVGLKPANDENISEDNPVTLSMNLAGKTRTTTNVEKILLEAPSENAPTSGKILIPNEDGTTSEFDISESNSKRLTKRTTEGEDREVIEVDLKGQVAVSEITIKVTGSRSNKNLTEIAKVEFLNNVYKEIPAPKMNIPVINNFQSTTAVGNESLTLGWEHVPNVTGYEIKVQKLKENSNQVDSTSTYKTSENTLRIEKVDGYATYRVSIQSLSGDEWKSGYKDEQTGYKGNAVGETNLTTNANDKDGKPDNVDSDYQTHGWDSNSGILSNNATGV